MLGVPAQRVSVWKRDAEKLGTSRCVRPSRGVRERPPIHEPMGQSSLSTRPSQASDRSPSWTAPM